MFNISLKKPNKEYIQKFISSQTNSPFSYEGVGQSADAKPPKGYVPIHYRIKLGEGEETFNKAKKAIHDWEMFHLGWVELCWPNAPIEKDTVVAIVAKALGIWVHNACRIVYLVEEGEEIKKYGFGYGTLSVHAEKGEERFLVEWHKKDNSVWYDLFSFSLPNAWWAKLGNLVVKKFQHRFADHSLKAMLKAVSQEGPT